MLGVSTIAYPEDYQNVTIITYPRSHILPTSRSSLQLEYPRAEFLCVEKKFTEILDPKGLTEILDPKGLTEILDPKRFAEIPDLKGTDFSLLSFSARN